MRRIYISDWRDKENRGGMSTPVEVFFTFKPEEAHPWPSKEMAESQCPMFDAFDVKVNWTEDGMDYHCKFMVEEHSPRAFVLFCGGAFVFKVSDSIAS